MTTALTHNSYIRVETFLSLAGLQLVKCQWRVL